jgi:hypothetical protein
MTQPLKLTAKRKGVRRLLEGKVEGGHRYQKLFWGGGGRGGERNVALSFKSHAYILK